MLTAKQQYWSEHLDKANSSGLSLAQYAKEQNIPIQKLYQWRSTLKKVTTTETVREEVKFAPVAISDYRPVALRLCIEDIMLEFSVLPEPEWLASLLHSGKDK